MYVYDIKSIYVYLQIYIFLLAASLAEPDPMPHYS